MYKYWWKWPCLFPMVNFVFPTTLTKNYTKCQFSKVLCIWLFSLMSIFLICLHYILKIKEWSQTAHSRHGKVLLVPDLSVQATPHHPSLSITQSSSVGRLFSYSFFLKDGKRLWGTWVAQSVKHLTLGFGSGHDLMVR